MSKACWELEREWGCLPECGDHGVLAFWGGGCKWEQEALEVRRSGRVVFRGH